MPKNKPALNAAGWLAIIGSAVALLPKLLAMSVLFQPEPLFFFIRHGGQIAAFSPWIAAVLLLAFSLVIFLRYRIHA